ncbi:AEC family transporter [Jhaorihella thermophila]
MVLNPFLLASLAGVAVGLSGLHLPDPVMAPLKMLAQAAIPVALISIGATMNWGALARLTRFDAYICATKLVALPALTFAASLGFGGGSGAGFGAGSVRRSAHGLGRPMCWPRPSARIGNWWRP